MMTTHKQRLPLAGIVLALLVLAGCGSSSSKSSSQPATHADITSATTTTTAGPQPAVADLTEAEHPRANQFPAAHGKTLQQLAATVHASAQLGAATGTFV